MALVTRELNNTGSPLYDPSGNVLANTLLRFKLINLIGQETEVFDATTGELVLSEVRVFTDANGLFSVNLWPNDRGVEATQYQLLIDSLFKIKGTVNSSNSPLSLLYFSIGEPVV